MMRIGALRRNALAIEMRCFWAAREEAPALARAGVEPVGKLRHQIRERCGFKRLLNLLVRDVFEPIREVVSERIVKDHDVLRDEGDLASQAPEPEVADVAPVYSDGPGLGLDEPRQQVDERGLSRARLSHDGDALARAQRSRRSP